MARAERIGLVGAVVGHALLFGALSIGWLSTPRPPLPVQPPIEISLVKDVAIEATPVKAPPAPSVAPDQGAPEDAPPPAAEPEPKPAPAAKSEAPPPTPVPVKPKPAKLQPAKPQPSPAKHEPAPAKAAPAQPAPHAEAVPGKTKVAATPAKGSEPKALTARPKGSRLGDDFLKGLSAAPARPAPVPAAATPAAKVGPLQAANISSAITRQVQPCANRQVIPGPGAERIRVTINLRLNRDGSLAARPRIIAHDGVDDENQRYLARVDDLAIATFVGCAPLRDLPDSLYDVQNGWSNFTMRYKLPG